MDALCDLDATFDIVSDTPAFADGTFWAGMTGSILVSLTNNGTESVSVAMPLSPPGLILPYNWSDNFLIIGPGATVNVSAEYTVTGAVGSNVVLDFMGCPTPQSYQIEYPNVFPFTFLNVMFMPGEHHEGGSDTEWAMDAVDAVTIDSGGVETPDSSYFGRFDLNTGTHVKAGTPIQMANGFYIHVIAAAQGGSNILQPVITNWVVVADLTLDPATATEFDAWWATMSNPVLEFVNGSGVVEYSVPISAGSAGGARYNFISIADNPWTQANKGKIQTVRLIFDPV